MEINFEEILNKHKNFQKSTVMMDDSYVAQRVAISAMKEVWNKAIYMAADNAEFEEYDEHMQYSPHISMNSILKLKV